MKTLGKYIVIVSIVIGVLAMAMISVFPGTISYITPFQTTYDPTTTYYKFDFYNYAQTLTNKINTFDQYLIAVPTRQWQNGAIEIIGWWAQLENNLAVILDWILFIINCILGMIRFSVYIADMLLAFIGVNVSQSNALSWLAEFFNAVKTWSLIPYI